MVYLDNAATTYPKPQSVVKSIVDGVNIYGGNPGRSGHNISTNTARKIFEVRESIATLFNADTEKVVFTSNCTMSLNMAIKGVLKKGSHVIISSLEHNSVSRPIYDMYKHKAIEYDIAKVSDDNEETVKNFAKLIKHNTKAIVCTYASNVTGKILPIAQISSLCKQAGIMFIVDSAQASGVIPIDVKELGIDILCTAGHKGLYGSTGTGLMIINTDRDIDTIIQGGTGSVSTDLNQPDFYPDKFESGTINTVGILSLGAGVDFIKRMGIKKIYEHEFNFCHYLYNQIKDVKNIKTYVNVSDYKKDEYVPIVAFNICGKSSVSIVDEFNARGFALRGGLHCSPLAHEHLGTSESGIVRFSPSVFNNSKEIMSFTRYLKQISKKL